MVTFLGNLPPDPEVLKPLGGPAGKTETISPASMTVAASFNIIRQPPGKTIGEIPNLGRKISNFNQGKQGPALGMATVQRKKPASNPWPLDGKKGYQGRWLGR